MVMSQNCRMHEPPLWQISAFQGERSLVTTCSEQAEDVAKKTCMKWMGNSAESDPRKRRERPLIFTYYNDYYNVVPPR